MREVILPLRFSTRDLFPPYPSARRTTHSTSKSLSEPIKGFLLIAAIGVGLCSLSLAQSSATPYVITTVAGSDPIRDGGPATDAALFAPRGVAVDSEGNLYIADSGATGYRSGGFRGDGGLATSARLNGPTGVAVDDAGNLYIADQLNHRIRKLALAAPVQLSILSGDGQNGPAATVLPRPLVVKVVGPDGAPLPEVEVSFSVISGSAKLSATSTITDVDGRAGVGVTLGNALGALKVAASVNGLQPVVFTLTATARSAKGEPLPAQKLKPSRSVCSP